MRADVVEEIISSEPFMLHHIRVIRRWTITIPGTSYRCVITECSCGLRDQIGVTYVRVDPADKDYNRKACSEVENIHSVARAECLCTGQTCRLGKRAHKCHGWHAKRVDQLVGMIDKMPKRYRISTSMRSYPGVAA